MAKPVTRTPGCTHKGCPWPKEEALHHCWYCGEPATDHQHVPKRSQGGTRYGAMLCQDCHDKVDNQAKWTNTVDWGAQAPVWTLYEGNHVLARREVATGRALMAADTAGDALAELCERRVVPGTEVTEHPPQAGRAEPLSPAQAGASSRPGVGAAVQVQRASPSMPGTERLELAAIIADMEALSEEQLAELWNHAQGDAENALLRQCAVASCFYARYPGKGNAWAERAAEVCRQGEGRSCSSAQMRDRLAMSIALQQVPDPEEALSLWGSTLTRAVGRAKPDNLSAAIAAAYEARDNGAPMVKTADVIERQYGSADSAKQDCDHSWRCAKCGMRQEGAC